MLFPLKVKICYDGKYKYPPFDEIPAEMRNNMEWTKYFDFWGGWHYDRLSGFGEADDYNPDHNCLFGVVLVGEDFAKEATKRWPELCEVLDEDEMDAFYNDRAHSKEPAVMYNADILNGIRAKYGIVGKIEPEDIAKMDEEDKCACDPDHPSPGMCKNVKKSFKDFKSNRRLKLANKVEVNKLKR